MELWMLLGEARSKIQHLGESLVDPDTGEELRRLYLAKGVHATTAIEGNTLSEQEVVEHLAGRLKLPKSQAYRAREIDNVVEAYNHVAQEIWNGSWEITPDKIKQYNRLILDGLELEDGVVPGELAVTRPAVGRYLAPEREDCDYLLERLCDWLNGDSFRPPNDELVIPFAIIKAVVAHLYISWIHYFGDGNGRAARCVELKILIGNGGVPMPAAHLLSNHYNATRDEYYRQLDAASMAHDGDPLPFLTYAVSGLVDGLREQLRRVWFQLFSDRWEQYIYQQFGEARTTSRIRQRQLVLDLSKHEGAVPRPHLRDLSAKVATAYAKRGDKTLTRDLNILLGMELIVQARDGFRANREKILSLMPAVPPTAPNG